MLFCRLFNRDVPNMSSLIFTFASLSLSINPSLHQKHFLNVFFRDTLWICLCAVLAAHLAELETTCHLHLLGSPWQSGANDLEGYTVPLHMGIAACVSLCVFVCMSMQKHICGKLWMQFSVYVCLDESKSLLRLLGLFAVCLHSTVDLCLRLCVSVPIVDWDYFSSA